MHEQQGAERAEYGEALLKQLSAELIEEFGKGFSKRNLECMRKCYLTYQDRQIAQMPTVQLQDTEASEIESGGLAQIGCLPQIFRVQSRKLNLGLRILERDRRSRIRGANCR